MFARPMSSLDLPRRPRCRLRQQPNWLSALSRPGPAAAGAALSTLLLIPGLRAASVLKDPRGVRLLEECRRPIPAAGTVETVEHGQARQLPLLPIKLGLAWFGQRELGARLPISDAGRAAATDAGAAPDRCIDGFARRCCPALVLATLRPCCFCPVAKRKPKTCCRCSRSFLSVTGLFALCWPRPDRADRSCAGRCAAVDLRAGTRATTTEA